ncbi:MAG TPA: sulfurtransferase [Flavobacteriales bacterium]|nr:sulfurtransferase [Flavobacteriales bacterium]|tara:strand:- start:464 stop:793 length:330 start_codon:yes stop_codon:yes gene_type:complete
MKPPVPTITPRAVRQWQEECKVFSFLDIREIHEVTVSRLTEFHLPMASCLRRQAEIPRTHPVVLYCRTGERSAATVSALITKHGFDNLHSLEGGMTAWCAVFSPEEEVG